MDAWFYVVLVGVVAAALVCIWASVLTIMDWIRDRHQKRMKKFRFKGVGEPIGHITEVWTADDGIHAELQTVYEPNEPIQIEGLKPGVQYFVQARPVHRGIDFSAVPKLGLKAEDMLYPPKPTDLLPDN